MTTTENSANGGASSRRVRTRIAPSPTGDPHVGTAYIALFNLCFARQHGGDFILRIEDTDQARSTPESEALILESLRWLGLSWAEGPDVGGPHAPYRQSERGDRYRKYAEQLIESGHAFYCFRTSEELDQIREERKAAGLNPGIKGDLELPKDEVERRLAAGDPYVVRMKVPDEGVCVIDDMLRGTIEIEWSQVDCQILLKSDGMPTYHLANVVDDHEMEISHVIRGEEWISSAPKHKLLYDYFGWELPSFCHMPLLRNEDKTKLSKRKNPVSIRYFERLGILPETLLNFLGRMGWSMPDERERFDLATMIEHFDIKRVSLGGPVFSVEKLLWLNGVWIRESLDDASFAERVEQWGYPMRHLEPVVNHIRTRVSAFSDIAPMTTFLFAGELPLTPADFEHSKFSPEDMVSALQLTSWTLDAQQFWDKDALFAALKSLAAHLDVKLGVFMFPVFVSVAGTSQSWSIVDSMEMLGPDMTRARLRSAIKILGGLSKKKLKQAEKDYAEFLAKKSE
ncbi:glutamate--tRNA ligase [Allohahella sp. A8]|uniref:glutamate--tRNA ligase n=1 Tax=Allohahella sp. A8 TaxID=3141461 RepID=UPI003A7FD9A4